MNKIEREEETGEHSVTIVSSPSWNPKKQGISVSNKDEEQIEGETDQTGAALVE